jgi:hypothetical protein
MIPVMPNPLLERSLHKISAALQAKKNWRPGAHRLPEMPARPLPPSLMTKTARHFAKR